MLANSANTGVGDFGERLETFLKIADIQKMKLAEMMNVTKTTITSYVQSRSEISFANMHLLYQRGLNLTWLITGKETMFADNEWGNVLERKIVRNREELYENELPVANSNVSKPSWYFDYKKALKYGNKKQVQHLAKIANYLMEDSFIEVEESEIDAVFILACKLVYEADKALQFAMVEANEQEEQTGVRVLTTTTIEKPPEHWEYYRYSLVRSWLTVTGSMEEWWMKCREVQPDMTFNEVLALEGLAEMPLRGNREKYNMWLAESGINLEWLVGVGENVDEPFAQTKEGEGLQKAIFHRVTQRKLALVA